MKQLLALILTIVVALTALTPCCGVDDCQDSITAEGGANHQKPDDGYGCSPFFACAYCPGFTITGRPLTIPAPLEFHPQYFEEVVASFSSSYYAAPWQPPRIA